MHEERHQSGPGARRGPEIPVEFIVLAAITGGIELILQGADAGLFGGPEWRLIAASWAGVWDISFDAALRGAPVHPQLIWSVFTFGLVNHSMLGALFGVALLLALGKFLGAVYGAAQALALYFVSGVFGAVSFCLMNDAQGPLFGALDGTLGMLGAFLWLRVQTQVLVGQGWSVALMAPMALFALWAGFALIAGGGANLVVGQIGVVLFGAALTPVMRPGGLPSFAQIRDALRRR